MFIQNNKTTPSFAMKKKLLFLCLFSGISLIMQAQTLIRFVPDKSFKSIDAQTLGRGTIRQTGNDFSGEVHIELPEKTLQLRFRPSPIKQYNKVQTSTGEQPSQAELYEAVDDQKKYYLTTIRKQFSGLFLSENGNYSGIAQSKDAFYSYQKMTPNDSADYRCAYNSIISSITTTARLRPTALPTCLEFPVAFVNDYMYYLFSNFDAAKVEADNLMRLATTQEIFSPYAFKAEITFKAIGHMVYTNQASSPWTTEITRSLADPATDLQLYWVKPDTWKKHKSLIVAGITGINFQGTLPGYGSLWGYTKATQNEFGMGSFLIKGFLNADQSRWIFAHEMGHIFGAQHDSDIRYLMYQLYSTTQWSPFSKTSINSMLDDLNLKNLLRQCPVMTLTYEVEKDSLAFVWKTNYDDLSDSFVIEYSSDEQKTWQSLTQIPAKGVFDYKLRLISKAPLSAITYYRVRQKGFNQIISNVLRISITSSENTAEFIKVFPNPVTNQLNIQLLVADNISIYTITGKRLFRTNAKQSLHLIDTAAWPTGIYFVQADNSKQVYKVIK